MKVGSRHPEIRSECGVSGSKNGTLEASFSVGSVGTWLKVLGTDPAGLNEKTFGPAWKSGGGRGAASGDDGFWGSTCGEREGVGNVVIWGPLAGMVRQLLDNIVFELIGWER
jgi:hypothetical protein